jgi:hypothetical protein
MNQTVFNFQTNQLTSIFTPKNITQPPTTTSQHQPIQTPKITIFFSPSTKKEQEEQPKKNTHQRAEKSAFSRRPSDAPNDS